MPVSRSRATNSRRDTAASGRFAWFIVVIGVLSASALAFYGFWHGGFGHDTHAEWLKLSEELRKNGEPMMFADVKPADIPDDQNFFRTDVFAGLDKDEPTDPLLLLAAEPGRGLSVADLLAAATKGNGASLEAIAAAMQKAGLVRAKTEFLLAGDRVRAGMRTLGLDFGPLAAAADLPAARFPINYAKPFPKLPHLRYLEALGDWLAIRAVAELSSGDAEAAAIDLLLIGRLAESLRPEPFLASQRTRRLLLGLFAGCVRVGISWGAWTDEQLERFGASLGKARLVPDLAWAVRGERAQLNAVIDLAFNGEKPTSTAALRGWLGTDLVSLDKRALRAREVAINRAMQDFLDALNRPDGIAPSTLEPPDEATLPSSPKEHMQGLIDEARGAAQLQTYVAQAVIACALERSHFVHGEYPEKLDALTPDLLATVPFDPMTAKPLAYKITPKGGYVITGAGWKEAGPWLWTRD